MVVLKPVIYFHTQEKITNIFIEINSIRNATVIPNTTIDNTSILWNVTVESNSTIYVKETYNPYLNETYDPYREKYYPYLFYEGIITCSPNIIANVTTDGVNVTFYVKNMENYTITDIYFIFGNYFTGESIYGPSHYGKTYIQIDQLESEEEKTITVALKNDSYYNFSGFTSVLIEKGLTEIEAKELVDYWKDWWFYPGYYTFSRLIYIIPQSVYDELLPLSISPAPNSTKRIGVFTIDEIPMYGIPLEIPDEIDETKHEEQKEKSPGFEFIIILCPIITILFWTRKKK